METDEQKLARRSGDLPWVDNTGPAKIEQFVADVGNIRFIMSESVLAEMRLDTKTGAYYDIFTSQWMLEVFKIKIPMRLRRLFYETKQEAMNAAAKLYFEGELNGN